MIGLLNYVPLFNYPVCCLCYEALHTGHKGWDVCAECRKYELIQINERGMEDPMKDEYKPGDWDCPCYRQPAPGTEAKLLPGFEEVR